MNVQANGQAERLVPVVSQLLAVLALSMCFNNAVAADQSETVAAVDLVPFGKFEVRPLTFEGKSGASLTGGATFLDGYFQRSIPPMLKHWATANVLRGNRTLVIHPEIVQLRLGSEARFPVNSLVRLKLRLTDRVSGEIIGEPEFSARANAIKAAATRGLADDELLRKVVNQASAFLAGSYRTAKANVESANAQTVARYQDAATGGDASAQLMLGSLYSTGEGISQSDEQACSWWRKAADQGNATAQLNLGWAYANGRGVIRDDTQAVAWWKIAAEQGSADAQLRLGSMYEEGRGVRANGAEATKWYGKAATQGHAGAKTMLARAQRGAVSYASFDDARFALDPEVGQDVTLLTDPMSLKGRVIILRLEIAQALGNGQFLLTRAPLGVPSLDGKIFYAEIHRNYRGGYEFVDDQLVDVVAEVIGTYRYTTTLGAAKTVPKMSVLAIRSAQ